MSFLVPFSGPARVTIPAGARLQAWSAAPYQLSLVTAPVDINGSEVELHNAAGFHTTAVYTGGAIINISGGGDSPLYYSVGTAAVVTELLPTIQRAPGALNATGTLTAALIKTGIVSSTSAANVTATLDTGAIMELASTFAINDCFDWSVINTGPSTFTVTAAASGHTVVGAGAVATATSGRFRTRKTALDTFVSYRLS
jgi:hypothetical protein